MKLKQSKTVEVWGELEKKANINYKGRVTV